MLEFCAMVMSLSFNDLNLRGVVTYPDARL